jgi:MFS family permease
MGFDLWLFGICSFRVFTYLVFMTYAAALPVLQREWGLSAAAAGSISSGFHIGYAFSLVIFSELADRIGAKRIFLWSNACTATASLLFAVLARGYYFGFILYTLIGISLGGVYTPSLIAFGPRLLYDCGERHVRRLIHGPTKNHESSRAAPAGTPDGGRSSRPGNR